MTPPLVDSARTRPVRSCLACRTAKHRCVGGVVLGENTVDALADQACERCIRLGTSCLFAGLRRMGRPRRLEKWEEPKARLLTLEKDSATGIAAQVHSEATAEKAACKNDDYFMDHSSEGFSIRSDASGSDTTCPEGDDRSQDYNFSSDLLLDELLRSSATPPFLELPVVENFLLPPMEQLFPDITHFTPLAPSQIYTLAQLYLSTVHPFLPLFDIALDPNSIALYLSVQSPLLSLALRSLVFKDDVFIPAPEAFGNSIADLQAGLLTVYACHGRGDTASAASTFAWVSEKVIAIGWHLVDHSSRSCTILEDERRAIRKIWWEAWSVDIFIGIVTGSREFKLQNIPFEVHPLEPTTSGSTLKLRALALLVSCTEPPPSGPLSFPAARIPALLSLASTIYILSHSAYHSIPDPLSNAYDIAASREASFMAVLISSASSIYLLSSSSQFSAFIASALPCGLDTISAPPPVEMHHALRNASNQIFEFLTVTFLPQKENALSLGPGFGAPDTGGKISHSPFFGCAILVATQGALLTFDSEESSLRNGGQGHESQTASFRAGFSWRAVQVRSHLDLAEWILSEQAVRWTGAGMILKEVKALRSAKRGMSLEHGMLRIGT